MEEVKTKIKTFTDLMAWREGHELVLMIYKITDSFPKEEIYALISQMRRSTVSITSNIAEGFSRQSRKEKIQFYYMALGSTIELQNQLLVAKNFQYLTKEKFNQIASQTINVHKLTNGLIRSLKRA